MATVNTFVRPTSGAAWSAKGYTEGEYVVHGGTDYRCIQTHGSSQEPPNATYWTSHVYSTISTAEANTVRDGSDASITIEEKTVFSESPTLNIANSSAYRVVLTVKSDCRGSGYWGDGARLEGQTLWGNGSSDYWTVEHLLLKKTGGASTFVYMPGDNSVVRNCILNHSYGTHGIWIHGSNGEVHACSLFRTGSAGAYGIRLSGSGTHRVFHNTVFNMTTVGIYRSGGTVIAGRNYSLGNETDFSGSFDAASDHNISSDASAAALNATKDFGTSAAHEVFQGPWEMDPRLCFSRQWPDDVVFTDDFETDDYDPWGTKSTGGHTFAKHADAALRNSRGLKITVASSGANGYWAASLSNAQSDAYIMIAIRPTNAYAMADGDAHLVWQSSTGQDGRIWLRRSGSDYQIGIEARAPNHAISYFGAGGALWGETTWVLIRRKKDPTVGIQSAWYWNGSSWISLHDYTSQNTDAYAIDILYTYIAFVDAGTSGDLYLDFLVVTTSQPPSPPDDTTSPYGDEFSDALTSYIAPTTAPAGCSHFPDRDICGNLWTDKSNTWHVGCENYSLDEGGAPPAGIVILRRRIEGC